MSATSFCINVWLKVKEAERAPEIARLLGEAARLSGQEPGCERFELYQSQADATRFLLVEHWATREAWVAHRAAEAYTTIYQPQVMPHVERDGHICTRLA